MSNKDALQRYEPDLAALLPDFPQDRGYYDTNGDFCGRGHSDNAMRKFAKSAMQAALADAHAHYEAQVRPLGGLARPGAAAQPTGRAPQIMKLVEQYGGAMALIAACQCDQESAGAAHMAASLYNRINLLVNAMADEVVNG